MPDRPDHEDPHTEDIHVAVTFPASKHGTFTDEVPPGTTVGTVRGAAMVHFEVADDDPQYEYYLTSDRQRREDTATVGELAGKAQAIKFRLVKDLRQG